MTKIFLSFTLIFTLACQASASREVLMRFWADEDYVRPIGLDSKPVAEKYLYHKGDYYPGPHENEEDAIKFNTVARILVGELSKQNYVLARDQKLADFILMVHWGQTSPQSELVEVTYTTVPVDVEPDTIDVLVEEFITYEVPEHVRRQSARLLGASKVENMSYISLKKRHLEEAVLQDRYFINIFAISINDIRNRNNSDEELAATWECQLSVPVDGRNSEDAFRALAKSGSRYFGQDVDDLQFLNEGLKQGVVRVGEIRFLDTDVDLTTEDSKETPKKQE